MKYFYKNIDQAQKDFVASYIAGKAVRLGKLLGKVPDETVLLEVKVERFVKKEAFRIEFILHTPKKKYIASEDDHTIREAVDLGMDKLLAQLRRDFSA